MDKTGSLGTRSAATSHVPQESRSKVQAPQMAQGPLTSTAAPKKSEASTPVSGAGWASGKPCATAGARGSARAQKSWS